MSELAEKLIEAAAALKEPIPGPEPQGADLSYDADFDVVRIEIDKLTAMTGETPNWRSVVTEGESLLKSKTKDMRLVVWVAAARMKTEGLVGFAGGLAGIAAVSGAHWDAMYPPLKRAKARANLLTWLGDLFLADFGEYVPVAKDKAVFEAIDKVFAQADELLGAKLADAYQGFGPIRSWLRDKGRMIPAEAPPPVAAPVVAAAAPAPAAAPAAAAPQPAAMAAPAVPAVTGAADVLNALRALGKGISDAARVVRQAEPTSAWAFRLGRTGTWLAVKQLPPAEGGATKIPPPQAADVKKLQSLLEAQQWGDLVSHAEGLASRFLFWIDPHRYVAVGLERLGAGEARSAVVREVLAFLAQQPAVEGLSFADGTPFADEGTKTWLEEERAKSGGGGGGGAGAPAKLDEEEVELKARFEEAKELVSGGKVAEGLGLAMQLARRGADARARFRARLETAQLALKGGKPELARPLLDGLVAEAEAHRLDEWEPELCSKLYAALLKARTAAPRREGQSLGDEDLFDRLCRLDLTAAVRAAGG